MQYSLLLLLEKWKKCLDNKGKAGLLLTDLSKAFDCLDHELLIAKLEAYGFGNKALKLVHSYLTGRFQRVRINSTFSTWSEIFFGVIQGSILGPILFNIDLADMFLVCKDISIASYADDNSPYACEKDMQSVIDKLQNDSIALLNWFKSNGLLANPDKFHLILSEPNHTGFIEIENLQIQNSKYEKLLGIKIDGKLSFEAHVISLCNTAMQKLHALIRVAPYMAFNQKRLIMRAFINSQFCYCPLVWMFCSRKLNNKINKIHERALRTVYNDHSSSFEELLRKDNAVTIHIKNLQALAIEIFKVINNKSPEIMNLVFAIKKSRRYPSENIFETRNIRTSNYGTSSLAYLAPKIWEIVPPEFKSISSIELFKKKIRSWNPTNCPCKLCKTYVNGVGYID